MIPALILFALTYVLMLVFSKYRPYIALASALIFIVSGMLPLSDVIGAIDFNVLLMIAGTMGLVALFIESKMPSLLADLIMEKVPNVQWAAVALSLFAGVISAFVDNVATVLMIAPVALAICKKLNTNPVPFIIGIAVSSNLQGAATLVGDTTAIMLGSALDMSFMDFFWFKSRPSMFFAVELGAVLSAFILAFIFRKEKAPIPKSGERTVVTDYVPTILLVGTIVLLILASFIPNKPDITNGLICFVLLIIGVIYNFIKKKNVAAITGPLKEIDFETIGLLLGLFLMIGGISAQGVIDAAAGLLAKAGGGNLFFLYTVIVWASVLISAFIDNIPYVATMIPVIGGLAATMGIDPTVLYFGLLSGATLGGNCTPIGASANITGIGILRKEGYTVKNSDFFKIGIPFTLAAIIPAYIYIWLMYGGI
ncbi:MAG: arsenic transporter [Oscillospiraceae bacterium]|nr:arsenic transporter [Oscillospiraceae bacterium]MBQ8624527.1 arsenic transporter [Oscillospiraceae bacterium]